MRKTIFVLLLTLLSSYCYCQFLMTIENNSDYKRKKYLLITFSANEQKESQIHNFDVFNSNIFNYIFCCNYGTLSFPKTDSIETVDSIKLSASKEELVRNHYENHYNIVQTLNNDKGRNLLKLERRYKNELLKISVGSLQNPSFCKCKEIEDETFTYTLRSNVTFKPLTKDEKSFFRRKVLSLIKSAPIANPILWN